jgi:hypothetical protein
MCANASFCLSKANMFALADLQPSLWTTARHLANAVTSDLWPHECFVSLRMALLLSLITSEVRTALVESIDFVAIHLPSSPQIHVHRALLEAESAVTFQFIF